MGKKQGGNLKKEQGNERKEQQKQSKENEKQAQKAKLEDEEWQKGSKVNKKDAEQEKKAEALRKKQERELLLQMEEKELSQKRPLQRQPKQSSSSSFKINVTEEYSATGVENALELLNVDSVKLDRHPERRMKAAFTAFEERMLPILKQDNPSLRLSQLKELLQKEWKKSPDNPLNQENVSYNATQEEYNEKKTNVKNQQQEKYRVK